MQRKSKILYKILFYVGDIFSLKAIKKIKH